METVWKCLRKREREKERETWIQRDRETERQRDRETERQRDRETERQRDRETERQRMRERRTENDKIKFARNIQNEREANEMERERFRIKRKNVIPIIEKQRIDGGVRDCVCVCVFVSVRVICR
jgi:hypothetical protein